MLSKHITTYMYVTYTVHEERVFDKFIMLYYTEFCTEKVMNE